MDGNLRGSAASENQKQSREMQHQLVSEISMFSYSVVNRFVNTMEKKEHMFFKKLNLNRSKLKISLQITWLGLFTEI